VTPPADDAIPRLDDYDYDLPPDRIAQEPTARRDASRLLVLDRSSGRLTHARFAGIAEFLRADDLLVVNDTRVVPARLRARRETGGAVEVFLVEPVGRGTAAWRVLVRPGKAFRAGQPWWLVGEDGDGDPRDVSVHPARDASGAFMAEFRRGGDALGIDAVVALAERVGETPLPPYIRRERDDARTSQDRERYQTVWAREPGAVAAPTAGLHFSAELLEALEARGVEKVAVTLHVGLDTFQPLTEATLASGELHGERVEVSEEAGAAILRARDEGRRIVAVGTTTARTLESFAAAGWPLPYRERTTLFIHPPRKFRLVDALVTNFHLPRSSLLMMVSAFADRELVLEAYRAAVEAGYRFYSYGDAMLMV